MNAEVNGEQMHDRFHGLLIGDSRGQQGHGLLDLREHSVRAEAQEFIQGEYGVSALAAVIAAPD
jgi:hypothetical protein